MSKLDKLNNMKIKNIYCFHFFCIKKGTKTPIYMQLHCSSKNAVNKWAIITGTTILGTIYKK